MRDQPSAAAERARVRFVLVEPQFGGNIGAAARALKNLGYARLVLVAPAADPQGSEARMMAVDAADVLAAAHVTRDLDAALAGAATVVGTSRRAGKHRRPHWSFEALAPTLVERARGGDLAVVFGREDHGLADAELDRCTHLASLPAAPAYPSYNLAQAVLLVAYELDRAWRTPATEREDEPLATHEDREALYAHLEQAFAAIGFLSRDTVTPIMRRLRRLFGRAAMTHEEVRLLRGVARQTLWVAGRAGLAAASDAAPGEAPALADDHARDRSDIAGSAAPGGDCAGSPSAPQ
jgi:TrmH family RNA methyltransferase